MKYVELPPSKDDVSEVPMIATPVLCRATRKSAEVSRDVSRQVSHDDHFMPMLPHELGMGL